MQINFLSGGGGGCRNQRKQQSNQVAIESIDLVKTQREEK